MMGQLRREEGEELVTDRSSLDERGERGRGREGREGPKCKCKVHVKCGGLG